MTDVVKPLFFRDEQYGYVIFEAQDDETVHLEELRGQISDSLMYALMMTGKSRWNRSRTDGRRIA